MSRVAIAFRPVRRAHIRVVVGLLPALLAAACGGGGPTSSAGGGTPAAPSVVTVGIQDFSFSPSTITIRAGSTVEWANNGPSAHTTTSDGGLWDSGTLRAPSGGDAYGGETAGGSFRFTFSTPGTYTYHCEIHPPSSYPDFVGTIRVTE